MNGIFGVCSFWVVYNTCYYNGSEYLEQARAAEADSTPVCSKYPE